jgi:hypothetical protein
MTKYYTPQEVAKAYEACVVNKYITCDTCPMNDPLDPDYCILRISWCDLDGYPDREKTLESAYQELCDPLYLDMLKVKESL